MKDRRRVIGIAAAVIGVLALLALLLWPSASAPPEVGLNAFSRRLAAGDVTKVTLLDRDHELRVTTASGATFRVQIPAQSTDDITRQITRARIERFTVDAQEGNKLVSTLLGLLPFAFILVVVIVLLRQARGARGLLDFGRKAHPVKRPAVTFADVAGLPEAVEELTEIRDFLVDPARFAAMGARIPKGVLLSGPPGTGK